MKITFGSACYRDLDSIFFTFTRAFEVASKTPGLEEVEYIIVDNYCKGRDSELLKKFCLENGINYLQEPRIGPALAKEAAIKAASFEWVIIVDSHSYLWESTFSSLIQFTDANPEFKGILFGGVQSRFGGPVVVQYRDHWNGEFWGVPHVVNYSNIKEPFEVWAAPNGIFAVRKSFWPGFNPAFRGYGGEEIYICMKTRRYGGKCLHLPGFGIIHKFLRVSVPYPLTQLNKVRNFLIGMKELNIPIDRIFKHFVLGVPETDGERQFCGPLSRMPFELFVKIWENPAAFPPCLSDDVAGRPDIKPGETNERERESCIFLSVNGS